MRPLPALQLLAGLVALALASTVVVRGNEGTEASPDAAPAEVLTELGEPPATAAPSAGPPTEASTDTSAAPSPEPPVPVSRPALQARLEALLTSPAFAMSGATVGVAVRDEHGRAVVDVASDTPLLPASTMKMVTAASALLTFGAEHRFGTVAGVTAPVTRNGTVVGDLVLVGSGDPVLGTPTYERWIYPARPRTPLEELADGVVASGVRRITGAVVGDGNAFIADSVADGWPEHYLWELDARHITGLTVDGGLGYTVDERADPPQVTIELTEEPARLTAAAFARMLVERGVTIERGARAAPEASDIVEVVASVESPPLGDILRHMVERSDNQVADTLFQTAGVARAGVGSWAMGELAARAALATVGVTARGLAFADGSGLSREDRLTAGFLADLDAAMGSSPWADVWWDSLAAVGREGTLRNRLRGTIAEGRFLGKTGTLDDVKAVTGVVLGPGDRRYHLAVVANDARGADRTAVSVLMDELVLALVEDLEGCRREPLPVPSPTASPTAGAATAPATVPPYRLVCPATDEPDDQGDAP
ncbi:MAG: D-alanyl-D-alanine carboxypeptidase/D-alanyl-D-alanine-endopeptidase [Actinobacteria bacterium]|nr:D-alanyl-D-alanine carboxypeptidase/D-alanyl-D-alanine-endopeptidase [Actinomycetota bacterium]